MSRILNLDSFRDLFAKITGVKDGPGAYMSIEYIKDVSCMLAMDSAVHEGNLERHLQSEREMFLLLTSRTTHATVHINTVI